MYFQPTSIEQLQLQYELAMSIGTSLDMDAMLRTATGAFARKLNCTAVAVYRCGGGATDLTSPLYQIPRKLQHNRAYQAVKELLPARASEADIHGFCASLPLIRESEDGRSRYYLLPLPGFGFVVLVKEGDELHPFIVRSLEPLLAKLSQACDACLQNDALEQTYRQASLERNMLRTLIDNTPVIAFAVDANGIFLISEGFGLSALGRAPGEVVGQSIFDVYAGTPEILDQVRQALDGRRSTVTVTVGGLTFDAHYEPVRNSQDRVVGVVGVAHDITARHDAEQLLRAILNTVGEGILTTDPNGVIIMANDEAEQIFGYDSDRMLGTEISELLEPGDRRMVESALRAYRDEHDLAFFDQRMEMTAQRADRTRFPAEVRFGETAISGRTLITVSIRNITRRKESERMRDEFIANITHELRTPLSSIMGWTETLLSERPGPLTDLQRRFLGINAKSAGRLNSLVEQVLMAASIQRGPLPINVGEFALQDALQYALDSVQPFAEERAIQLAVRTEWLPQATMFGDSAQIEQLLTHLLDNAVKFSQPGAIVTLTSRLQDDVCEFVIVDRGIGIPDDERMDVFRRFYRSSNARTAEIHGSGLGLYICDAIVKAHGGNITIDSVTGAGTTVRVSLPRRPSPASSDRLMAHPS